tara:strand:+ start:35 stop:334 length:300 start_codon:yes stop_codon:yes gene_type:complete
MSGVATIGSVVTTTDPCNVTGVTALASGNLTVLVNGKAVCGIGDVTAPYPSGVPPVCISKTAIVASGNLTVLVGGKAIARIGDTTDAGPITTGSLNVLA